MWAILILLGASTPAVSAKYECKQSLRTDDESRDLVLLFHNVFRQNIAGSLQGYNYGKSKLGAASNMYKLEWDCKLEEAAEKIADTCDEKATDVYAQNGVKIRGDARYNAMSNFMEAMTMFTLDLWFYTGTITNVFKDANLSTFANCILPFKYAAMMNVTTMPLNGARNQSFSWDDATQWCSTVYFVEKDGIRSIQISSGRVIWNGEHDADMAYSKTTKMGCSYKWCDTDKFFAVCLYNRLGNRLDSVLWEEGKHCLKNEECTTYPGSTCNSQGLCVDAAHADDVYEGEKKEEIQPPAERIVPNPEGIIGDCPTDNGMTNEIRMRLLDKHNGYRTLVAKGEAENPLGSTTGYAPKAARMRKMVYDCNIEVNAMKNAAGCKYGHSRGASRPGLGENIWAMWGPVNYSLLKAAEGATGSWFSELKNPGMPEDNVLSHAVVNRPKAIGHYTQIVWQSTYHLGCGLKNCPDNMCYAVCQYGPAGNYLNSLLYEIGDPCKVDSDCKCIGCKCSKEEAMCIMPPSLPWTATDGILAA